MLLVDLLFFIFGFILVYYSVDYLLDELEEFLEKYSISPIVFGFLFLGIDLEESIASLFGAFEGLPELSIGNLIGNSIIAIVIGFAIPVLLLPFTSETIPKIYYITLFFVVLNSVFSLLFPSIFWIFGIIAILSYVLMLIYNIKEQKKFKSEEDENDSEEIEESNGNLGLEMLKILFFLVFTIVGGELMIIGATGIISSTSLNESFFGLVIMAFVTNVEEFWLMFKAIKKSQLKLGISTQLGKIFWNMSLIYGISALLINSYEFSVILLYSVLILLVSIGITLYYLMRNSLNRFTSILQITILMLFLVANFYFQII